MHVPMKLVRVIVSDLIDHQAIDLVEEDGDRKLTLLIGIYEALSIGRRARGQSTHRPLTHDLVIRVAESLGGELHDVIISDLKENTYYAKLRILRGEELIEIDARPSDAIAVAVTSDPHLPIFAEDAVLDAAQSDNG